MGNAANGVKHQLSFVGAERLSRFNNCACAFGERSRQQTAILCRLHVLYVGKLWAIIKALPSLHKQRLFHRHVIKRETLISRLLLLMERARNARVARNRTGRNARKNPQQKDCYLAKNAMSNRRGCFGFFIL